MHTPMCISPANLPCIFFQEFQTLEWWQLLPSVV